MLAPTTALKANHVLLLMRHVMASAMVMVSFVVETSAFFGTMEYMTSMIVMVHVSVLKRYVMEIVLMRYVMELVLLNIMFLVLNADPIV